MKEWLCCLIGCNIRRCSYRKLGLDCLLMHVSAIQFIQCYFANHDKNNGLKLITGFVRWKTVKYLRALSGFRLFVTHISSQNTVSVFFYEIEAMKKFCGFISFK